MYVCVSFTPLFKGCKEPVRQACADVLFRLEAPVDGGLKLLAGRMCVCVFLVTCTEDVLCVFVSFSFFVLLDSQKGFFFF